MIEQLGKRNIFALLSTIGLEDNIYDIFEILLNIQTKKRYSTNSPNFSHIFKIFKGIFEDYTVSTRTLSLILMKLNKHEKKETFNLAYHIFAELKNILASQVNSLIFNIIKDDVNERSIHKKTKNKSIAKNSKNNFTKNKDDSYNAEIYSVKNEKFLFILKKLSNISHQYLINLYSSIPLDEKITEIKIRGNSILEILYTLIKSKNSISIAEYYERIFNFFLNLISLKSVRESEKLKIIFALIKFNYKNPKEKIRKLGLKISTINVINKFLDEMKIESNILSMLNFIKKKIFKK